MFIPGSPSWKPIRPLNPKQKARSSLAASSTSNALRPLKQTRLEEIQISWAHFRKALPPNVQDQAYNGGWCDKGRSKSCPQGTKQLADLTCWQISQFAAVEDFLQ